MRLYLDEDSLNKWLVDGLRIRGFDVDSALEAETEGFSDESQLEFASGHDRAIVTANQPDFARLHSEWLGAGREHAGIVIRRQGMPPGEVFAAFEALRAAFGDGGLSNRLEFLGGWKPRGEQR